MKFSVVIPTYNSAKSLELTLQSVIAACADVEIIVVDGGSIDHTQQMMRQYPSVRFLATQRGRGLQLQAGAEVAQGDILIFLHADTLLDHKAFAALRFVFQNTAVKVGTFQMKFDQAHPLLAFYSYMTRYDSLWTSFGDQCVVVRHAFFKEMGGFPPWPLFEDVCFLQKARCRTKVYSFPSNVVTSAEKFLRNGIIRQQLKNGLLILQYLFGVSPTVLAKKYGY